MGVVRVEVVLAAVVVRARPGRVRAAAPAYGNRAAAAKAAVVDWVRAAWGQERAEVVAVELEEPAAQGSVVAVEPAEELELAVEVTPEAELAAGRAVAGDLGPEAALDPAAEGGQGPEVAREAAEATRTRLANGAPRRRCCATAWQAELAGYLQAFLAEPEQAKAAEDSPSRKKMFVRCWDSSRNWASRARIRNHGWMCRLFNRA